jgi:hypothetical protein
MRALHKIQIMQPINASCECSAADTTIHVRGVTMQLRGRRLSYSTSCIGSAT